MVNTIGEFWGGTGDPVAGIELRGHYFAAVHGAVAINRETVESHADQVGRPALLVHDLGYAGGQRVIVVITHHWLRMAVATVQKVHVFALAVFHTEVVHRGDPTIALVRIEQHGPGNHRPDRPHAS